MDENDKTRRRVVGVVESFNGATNTGYVRVRGFEKSIPIKDLEFCNIEQGKSLDAAVFKSGRRQQPVSKDRRVYLLIDVRNLSNPRAVCWAFADGNNEVLRHQLRSTRPIHGPSTPCGVRT